MAVPFARRLAAAATQRRTNLVLGVDPDPARLWPEALARAPEAGTPAERAGAAVAAHCEALIDAAGPECVAVKLQLACFERLGAPGWVALRRAADRGREHGLLIIADAKRGDVDVSARAYAQALLGSTPTPFGEVSALGADAMTVNPLLGADSLAPFVEVASQSGAGLFVLVRTSNPGAADLEDRRLADGGTVSERIAGLVRAAGERARGDGEALSDVGAVVGATAPGHLPRLRELMPHAPFLLPGVGAQGGRVADLAPAFAPGPAGGLVSASRSIAGAGEGADRAQAARAAAARLRQEAWSLAGGG